MANTIVLGMQWGDEGKGKIVDLICPAFDAVVRYQGGHNAGHTVKFGDQHYSLHLIPSGILHSDMRCLLGNGMVLAPDAFFDELQRLHDAGVDTEGRLLISDRVQIILPLHATLDRAREEARGKGRIGTTVRGIGPAYESKASRSGLRAADLLGEDLEERLAPLLGNVVAQLRHLGSEANVPEVSDLAQTCREWGQRLAPYLVSSVPTLHSWMQEGQSLLFEGAQGALLDIDHGTYPFVTSSSTLAGGAAAGAGVPPTRIDGAIGVVKAYTTRVGSGPFPTELFDQTGEFLRERGNEFGTTTGRPRRCGWFDAVAARYAAMLSGIDVMALTKLDVLDDLEEIEICVAYRHQGREIHDFPADISTLSEIEPVYRRVPGWRSSTAGILDPADLPAAARDYIALLENEVQAPVGLVSSGPRREETILLDQPELHRLLGDRLHAVTAARGTP